MQPYTDLLKEILEEGEVQFNQRTGAECKVIVGTQQKYDLREGFPALTTRKIPMRSIVGELIGFFRGYTNALHFRSVGCKFWDQNANETQSWLDNPARIGTDDLGRIYGKQWTSWSDTRIIPLAQTMNYIDKGYGYIASLSCESKSSRSEPKVLVGRSINQLERAVHTIMTNPSDRRIVITGLNIAELDLMSLPPCHLTYKFVPMPDSKTMHLVMDMRSMDFYLGTPANIASTAVFLAVVCRLTGYTPATITIQGANTHLYENSYEASKELILRTHKVPPQLVLSEAINPLQSLDEIKGCFERINPEDIYLENYHPDANIAVAMMA